MGKRNRHSSAKPKKPALIPSLRQQLQPEPFRIPAVNLQGTDSDRNQKLEDLLELIGGLSKVPQSGLAPPQPSDALSGEMVKVLRLLAEVTTGIWRTQQRMLKPGTIEPQEDMRRAYRPLQAVLDALSQAGVEIIDRTQQPYTTGLAERVVAFEEDAGISHEVVKETVKPAIYYSGRMLQQGEIIVGRPVAMHRGE